VSWVGNYFPALTDILGTRLLLRCMDLSGQVRELPWRLSARQRDRETERQRDRETERQRDRERKQELQ
jgi:hypothetical protein